MAWEDGIVGSAIIEVAIGVTFLFVTLSLVCSTVTEAIARLFERRRKFLADSLKKLVRAEHEGVIDDLLAHPMVTPDPERKPDRVEPEGFARAFLEKVELEDLKNGPLAAVVRNVGDDAEQAVANLAEWFEASMEQVTIWYRRHIQVFNRVAALVIVLVANADTIHYVDRLWTDNALRSVVVEQAKEEIAAGETRGAGTRPGAKTLVADVRSEIEQFPLGWQFESGKTGLAALVVPGDAGGWALKLLGLWVTFIAVTLGAPFWFDVLRRMVGVRRGPAEADE